MSGLKMLGAPSRPAAPGATPSGTPAQAPGAPFTVVHRSETRAVFLRPLACEVCGDEFFPREPGLRCDWCLLA
ncbi:hypothetical protein [Muricoccus nepalensis]|uniref:hypothetical protein n=1 Tax=Muricoccus nepalensis TaxID=1854500 RepID=UPI001125B5F9|nr:hypothetical protein [Roseomonas nepalensis]